MNDLTLIIPTKQEAVSLPKFLKELENYKFKKLIVIENEDKDTIEAIKNINGIEIYFQKNSGYGNALIEGIKMTKTKYFCIINADGSMDPSYLDLMLNECKNLDVVFASRYLKGGGSDDDDIVTFIGNKFFSAFGKLFFNLKISDILYTYFIAKTEPFKKLNLSYGDFRICVEIPIKVSETKLLYGSIPSQERKRITGKKKVNPIKDGFLILCAMIFLFF